MTRPEMRGLIHTATWTCPNCGGVHLGKGPAGHQEATGLALGGTVEYDDGMLRCGYCLRFYRPPDEHA